MFVAVALTASVNAATINTNSINPGAPGTTPETSAAAFFDNIGNELVDGSVFVFSGETPLTADAASVLVQSGTSLTASSFNNAGPGGGLVNVALSFDNTDGSVTNQNLFAVFTNEDSSEFIVYDLATVLLVDDSPTAPVSVFEQITDSSLVVVGNVISGEVDHTALGPTTPAGQGFNVQATPAVPEPSSALLAGLALLGGLARRRR